MPTHPPPSIPTHTTLGSRTSGVGPPTQPGPSQSSLHSMMSKKSGFLLLKEWELDRVERAARFQTLIDPVYEEVAEAVQRTKITNTQIVRILRERAKLDSDYARSIRASSTSGKPLRMLGPVSGVGGQDKDKVAGSKSDESHTPATELTSAQSFGGSSTLGGSFLSLQPKPWYQALVQMQHRQANAIEKFANFVENNLIIDQLQKTTDEFERLSAQYVANMREARTKMISHGREVLKLWADHDKTFLLNERLNMTPRNDKVFKECKDCWLSERRYILCATQSRQLQRNYFRHLTVSIGELQHLEEWRSSDFLAVLNRYVSQTRDTLASIAGAVGSAHAMIDPDGYSKAKAAFVAANKIQPKKTIGTNSLDKSTDDDEKAPDSNAASPTQSDGRSDNTAEVPEQDADDDAERRAREWACETIGIATPKSEVPKALLKNHVLEQAVHELNYSLAPESRLVIKWGAAKRQSGLGPWGKWSDGLLVLTWDRYLHMFRSHDDPNPVWSCCMNFVELRRIQERNGPATVELREKKNMVLITSSRSYYFRPLSESDLSGWLKCLTLACAADDLEFTSAGILPSEQTASIADSEVSVPSSISPRLSGKSCYGSSMPMEKQESDDTNQIETANAAKSARSTIDRGEDGRNVYFEPFSPPSPNTNFVKPVQFSPKERRRELSKSPTPVSPQRESTPPAEPATDLEVQTSLSLAESELSSFHEGLIPLSNDNQLFDVVVAESEHGNKVDVATKLDPLFGVSTDPFASGSEEDYI